MGGRGTARVDRLPARLKPNRPLRQQLEEILEGLIASSAPGDPLPSERALAERYGVARMTARQAIEAMLAKGLVYRLQGSGTFVDEARLVPPERPTSLPGGKRGRGTAPGAPLLRPGVAPPPAL